MGRKRKMFKGSEGEREVLLHCRGCGRTERITLAELEDKYPDLRNMDDWLCPICQEEAES